MIFREWIFGHKQGEAHRSLTNGTSPNMPMSNPRQPIPSSRSSNNLLWRRSDSQQDCKQWDDKKRFRISLESSLVNHNSRCSHSLLSFSFGCLKEMWYLWNPLNPPQPSPHYLGLATPGQAKPICPKSRNWLFEAAAHALSHGWKFSSTARVGVKLRTWQILRQLLITSAIYTHSQFDSFT
jgi:hypothetical protein